MVKAILTWLALAASASASADAGANAGATTDEGIRPFSAQFTAEWKSITVASSDLALRPGAAPDQWVYTWRISARGIFRLVYSDDVVQTSWFGMNGAHVRPNRYEATQGSSAVRLDFDWETRRAHGTSEGKPVDIGLQDSTQDLLSIQIEVMQDLRNGTLPARFSIVDKDEVKEFLYRREGAARMRTALGVLDTIIVASQREGNNRILRMWFAPALGFVPVQAERSRDGKLEFAMRIKSLSRP
ncbi:MAG: DUF3108 domain-containing protein [Steroidobacterales bacterium]